jgi:hypothetical protein
MLLFWVSFKLSFEWLPFTLPLPMWWWPILGKLTGDDGLDVGFDDEELFVFVEAGRSENWGSGASWSLLPPPPNGDSFLGLVLVSEDVASNMAPPW